jgi:hypothetical protein
MPLNDPTAVVTILANEIASRAPEVYKWEAYYAGKQGLVFASDAWKNYNANRFAVLLRSESS